MTSSWDPRDMGGEVKAGPEVLEGAGGGVLRPRRKGEAEEERLLCLSSI